DASERQSYLVQGRHAAERADGEAGHRTAAQSRKRHVFRLFRPVAFAGVEVGAEAGVLFIGEAGSSREKYANAAHLVAILEYRHTAGQSADAAGLGRREDPTQKAIGFWSLQPCSVRHKGVRHVKAVRHEVRDQIDRSLGSVRIGMDDAIAVGGFDIKQVHLWRE